MLRRVLAATALLPMLLACDDAPTAFTEAPEQAVAVPTPVLSAAALASFREVLDDDLVRELAGVADEEHPATRVRSALHALRERAAEGDAQAILDALTQAERAVLGDEDGGSDDVVLSALALILESAREVLEGKRDMQQDQPGSETQRTTPGDADDQNNLVDTRPTRRTR